MFLTIDNDRPWFQVPSQSSPFLRFVGSLHFQWIFRLKKGKANQNKKKKKKKIPSVLIHFASSTFWSQVKRSYKNFMCLWSETYITVFNWNRLRWVFEKCCGISTGSREIARNLLYSFLILLFDLVFRNESYSGSFPPKQVNINFPFNSKISPSCKQWQYSRPII
jgi:hypothetical protein